MGKRTILAFLFLTMMSFLAFEASASPPLTDHSTTIEQMAVTPAVSDVNTVAIVKDVIVHRCDADIHSQELNFIRLSERGSTVDITQSKYNYPGLISYTRIQKGRALHRNVLRC